MQLLWNSEIASLLYMGLDFPIRFSLLLRFSIRFIFFWAMGVLTTSSPHSGTKYTWQCLLRLIYCFDELEPCKWPSKLGALSEGTVSFTLVAEPLCHPGCPGVSPDRWAAWQWAAAKMETPIHWPACMWPKHILWKFSHSRYFTWSPGNFFPSNIHINIARHPSAVYKKANTQISANVVFIFYYWISQLVEVLGKNLIWLLRRNQRMYFFEKCSQWAAA